jgi:bacterioferritin-associated ferredoxin
MGYGLRSETQLIDLAGARRRYDARQDHWVPESRIDGRTSQPGVYVAGDGAGIQGAPAAELQGAMAALSLLEDLGRPVDRGRVAGLARRLARWRRFRQTLDEMFPVPVQRLGELPDDVVVCRCERITVGDVRRAISRFGAEDVNRVKSFSRAGMGRCQSRYCDDNVRAIVAAVKGVPAASLAPQRCQPPIKPIPIADWSRTLSGALALSDEAR